MLTTGLYVQEDGSVPLVAMNKIRTIGFDRLMKDLMDYSLALVALVGLSLPLALVAVLVKLDSPGPIFYRRRVMGVNGKQFDAFKFRTMDPRSEQILRSDPELMREYLENFKIKDDPRITRIGKFLRKTSIDELPQLVNVLIGQMSLVGPRMITPEELDKYNQWGYNLLTVKPGITGFWQVRGRSDVAYDERVRMDMYYIRNWTIWLDLQILVQTIPAVIAKRGAY
jgi:lipopolysaccharide/colanic/teichoic acid biosynthesis glycosyltransferase